MKLPSIAVISSMIFSLCGCADKSPTSAAVSSSSSIAPTNSSSISTQSSQGTSSSLIATSSSSTNTDVLVLADFENQNITDWSGRSDQQDGGSSTITALSLVASDAPNGGSFAGSYTYSAGTGSVSWGANMGMRSIVPQNLSAFDTIKFDIKSQASTILRFQIGFAPEHATGNQFACHEVITTTSWTSVSIPLDSLKACWTGHVPVPWSTGGSTVYEILWQNSRAETNTITIDNLRVIKPYQRNWGG